LNYTLFHNDTIYAEIQPVIQHVLDGNISSAYDKRMKKKKQPTTTEISARAAKSSGARLLRLLIRMPVKHESA
jgi:hypothetical protein